MTVTYKEYMEDKKAFFEKHDYDYTVDTSLMDEYGRYYKTYNFSDGAQWFEAMSPVTVTKTVEVEMVKVKVDVDIKLFRTEYWNTKSGSKYYFEKF